MSKIRHIIYTCYFNNLTIKKLKLINIMIKKKKKW